MSDRDHLKALCRLGEVLVHEPSPEVADEFADALAGAVRHLADTARGAGPDPTAYDRDRAEEYCDQAGDRGMAVYSAYLAGVTAERDRASRAPPIPHIGEPRYARRADPDPAADRAQAG